MRASRRITYELLDAGKLPSAEDVARGFEPHEGAFLCYDWLAEIGPADDAAHDLVRAFSAKCHLLE